MWRRVLDWKLKPENKVGELIERRLLDYEVLTDFRTWPRDFVRLALLIMLVEVRSSGLEEVESKVAQDSVASLME